MAKTGRPKKEIDKSQFEKLCGLQCTIIEIASFFNCSEDTIDRWCKREYGDTFAVVYKKYASQGKISLRRNQFKLSERSATMAIWLGKQMLDQEDKITVETIEQSVIDDIERQVILRDDDDDTTTGD
jgi:IS30 family transposase